MSDIKRDENYKINIVWGVEDVKMAAEQMEVELTTEECCTILDRMDRHHDAEYGICWETIKSNIEMLLDEKEKRNEARGRED
jgi:hypothetical protein